jgi:hypothetical protein
LASTTSFDRFRVHIQFEKIWFRPNKFVCFQGGLLFLKTKLLRFLFLKKIVLKSKKILFQLACVLWVMGSAHLTFAQGIGNNPLSVFGLGQPFNETNAPQSSMGGLGLAVSTGLWVNSINPALLATNRFTVFEMGTLFQAKNLRDAQYSQGVFSGNLSNINLTIPMSERWTMQLGIRPQSYVDYDIFAERRIQGLGDTLFYNYRGSGGINRVSLANGVRVGKSFYVGVEAAYQFGVINRSSDAQNINDRQGYIVSLSERYNYSSVALRMAVTYRTKLTEKLLFNVATSYDFGHDPAASRFRTFDLRNSLNQLVALQDTLSNEIDAGKTSLPGTFRVGVAFEKPYQHKKSFISSLDFSYTPWSQYLNYFGQKEPLRDSYTLAWGFEYTPDFQAINGLLRRTHYRFGINYTQTPYQHGGRQVSDLGVSFGLGIPIRNLSFMNVGMTLGSRGFIENQGIQENYGRIYLGFTLSDQWFRKYRID